MMKKIFFVLVVLMLVSIPAVSAENWFTKIFGGGEDSDYGTTERIQELEQEMEQLKMQLQIQVGSLSTDEYLVPGPASVEEDADVAVSDPGSNGGGTGGGGGYVIPFPDAIGMHEIFRLDIGETEELRNNAGGVIYLTLENIADNKCEIIYREYDGDGTLLDEQHFFAGVEDMGFVVEVLKMTENKALFVIPYFVN